MKAFPFRVHEQLSKTYVRIRILLAAIYEPQVDASKYSFTSHDGVLYLKSDQVLTFNRQKSDHTEYSHIPTNGCLRIREQTRVSLKMTSMSRHEFLGTRPWNGTSKR